MREEIRKLFQDEDENRFDISRIEEKHTIEILKNILYNELK